MQKRKLFLFLVVILIPIVVIFISWYFSINKPVPTTTIPTVEKPAPAVEEPASIIKEISVFPEKPVPKEIATFCISSYDEKGIDEVTFFIGTDLLQVKGSGEADFKACIDSKFPEGGAWQVQIKNKEGQISTKEIK